MMIRGNDETGAASQIGDDRPAVWVIADGTLAADASATAAEACGLRVVRRMSIKDASVAISYRQSISLVLIDVGTQVSPAEAGLLELLDRQACDSHTAVIVACARPALDDVAAYIAAPYATILCDPTGADRILAICAAMQPSGGVAETDRIAETLRLLHLTDEVARIARALADMPNENAGGMRAVSDGLTGYRSAPPSPSPMPVTASDIRTIIRWRRRREGLFADTIFADPAWDMMLDLAAARIEGIEVSVSSLCIAAAVPATTALRWIKALTEAEIFVRVADPRDRRRIHIRLADAIATTILNFLGEAKGAGAGLI